MSLDRQAVPGIAEFMNAQALDLRGRGRWRTTRCDFHGGSDSMRVNVESNGWCCMACGAHGGDAIAYLMQRDGLDFVAAAKAIGAWRDDGQSPRPHRPSTLAPRDALAVIARDAGLLFVVAADVHAGKRPNDADMDAFARATGRIQRLAMEYGE